MFFLLAFLLLFCTPLTAQNATDDDVHFGDVFLDHYDFISSLYPRLEGSLQEGQAVEYIKKKLSSLDVEYTHVDFSAVDQGHSFSSSIYVHIPGVLKDELLLIAPLNHRETAPYGEDGAINIALALAFVESQQNRTPPISLRILFLGSEFGPDSFYPIGTGHFLDEYFPEYAATALYLDFGAPPERVVIRSGDDRYVSPYWLAEQCTNRMDKEGLFYLVRGNENQFYRLGTAENPAPLYPYLDREYPAVSFHSSKTPLKRADLGGWARSFYRFLDGFIADNSGGFIEEWDRHYLSFQARGFSFLIKERSYILTLLCILGAMVLYPLVMPKRFTSYAASIFQNLWALPILLLLVYLLLLVGTLLVEGISQIKGYPGFWQTRPFIFFTLKMAAAVFLFTLLSRYVKRIPFPRRGRFYTASALLILFSDILVLGIQDISLSYYVLWACVWAFLFSLSSSRAVKGVCFAISMVWFFKISYDVFSVPVKSVAEKLILERGNGNLTLAFILFPFLLMLIRLDFMFRHPRKKTKRILLTSVLIALGVSCAGMTTYLLLYRPFSPTSPQKVVAREVHDLTQDVSLLQITSPASMPDLALSLGTETHALKPRAGTHELNISTRRNLVAIEKNTSAFLDRMRHTVKIISQGQPTKVDLVFTSPAEVVIYDSSFPYSYIDSSTVRVHIGRHPPNPLSVEFTVPIGQGGVLQLEAFYAGAVGERSLTGNNIAASWETVVRDSVQLGNSR